MSPDAASRVELEGPYDLVATLRRTAIWGTDPTVRLRDDTVWTAFRTPSGPATVCYTAASATGRAEHVEVQAWGPGASDAVERAPAHLGVRDRSWTFEHDHPIVGPLLHASRGLRFGRSGRVMERLVGVILAQKVTSQGASRSFRELVYRHGERAPGPEKLWLAPTAERLLAMADYDFHPLGVEQRRAQTILFAARRARRLEALAESDPGTAFERLVAFPGIGPWTAALVTSAVHGDVDAVPVGDFHIPHHVVHALTGEARGSDDQMLELLEPFRPFRGRALAAILRGTPGPPRFGPRLSERDIRNT
jgi:3-methyladenine DNA glycosylase/8-oxoguanine DNA glycosylase